MSKKLKYVALFFLSVSFFLIGFTNSALAVKTGGTITVGAEIGPIGWDPHVSTSTGSWDHQQLVYESLLRYNAKMEIEPSLAVSWEQPNPLTLIFHLRKNVKFHNGKLMTAEDVEYSIKRMMDPEDAARPSYWKAIKSVEIIDAHTVKLTLKEIDVSLLGMIASNKCSSIVPKEHGDLKTVVCGTGPFKMTEYRPGDFTEFKRNNDYWEKGFPRVDRVIFREMKDEISRSSAIRRGAIDISWFVSPQLVDAAKRTTGLRVSVPSESRYAKFYLHHSRFPGNNKKLRQAISAALDRKMMIQTVLMGEGKLSTAIPPASAPYSLSQEEIPKLPFYKRDLKLAKKLMQEAGYPNGFKFDIVCSARNPDWIPTAEAIKSNLNDIGIEVNIMQTDFAVHLKRWREGDFAALLMLAGVWYPTPDTYISTFFHSKSKSNYFGYKNAELDKLFDESSETLDEKKRLNIWKKIQYVMAEDVALICLFATPAKYEVINNRIKDYYFMDNTSRFYLRDAWIDK